MLKILLTGGTSKTAEAIAKYYSTESNYDLFILSSDTGKMKFNSEKKFSIDYANKKDLKKIVYGIEPDVVVNCAALTNVDECETNKSAAWNLNAELVETIAKMCRVMESRLITFSTDYIFDGQDGPYSETSMPNPLSNYGKTKLAGENLALSLLDELTIIRTNVVYGASSYGKGDFIRWIIEKLENGESIKIIEGQWCNPTYVRDLARSVSRAIINKSNGIFNVAGTDYLNRYEIALKIADYMGFDEDLIEPISVGSLKQLARRPVRGGLLTGKAENEFGIIFTGLEEGLEKLKFDMLVCQK